MAFERRLEFSLTLSHQQECHPFLQDGFVFRLAACQLGQKAAGSPLGCLVRAVALFCPRLTEPVHVAAWVDDLIFIMSTPAHGECACLHGLCSGRAGGGCRLQPARYH